MPRQPRQQSGSGVHHLITRVIGKQILFEDRGDYRHYLSILRRFCGETGVILIAYCLMENHVHLLARDPGGQVPLLMKKLGVSYSGYYNRKYGRSGHLFQDRYLNEPVEDDAYLLAVFRYILQNPEKAGICPAPRYEWSSYGQYDDPASFVDTALIRELLGDRDRYAAFLSEESETVCLEAAGSGRNDERAKEILRTVLGAESGAVLQSLDRAARNAGLRKLKQAGLSVRQIERLTGISRNIVQRA